MHCELTVRECGSSTSLIYFLFLTQKYMKGLCCSCAIGEVLRAQSLLKHFPPFHLPSFKMSWVKSSLWVSHGYYIKINLDENRC